MPDEPDIESPSVTKPPEETYRILILDSPETVERFKSACKRAGHSVVPAHTGEEALAFLDGTDHVDVIVCAAHLADESVFEFLRRVRDDERHTGVAILMVDLEPGPVASRLTKSTERAGKAMGVDAYVTMPEFSAAKLLVEIERLLPTLPSRLQDPSARGEPAAARRGKDSE